MNSPLPDPSTLPQVTVVHAKKRRPITGQLAEADADERQETYKDFRKGTVIVNYHSVNRS